MYGKMAMQRMTEMRGKRKGRLPKYIPPTAAEHPLLLDEAIRLVRKDVEDSYDVAEKRAAEEERAKKEARNRPLEIATTHPGEVPDAPEPPEGIFASRRQPAERSDVAAAAGGPPTAEQERDRREQREE